MGEGGYYAPELTKVYERRGAGFIAQMLRDPELMYPGQRKMVKYKFTEDEIASLVAFLKWVGEMDLNGFPPKPDLIRTANPTASPNAQPGVLVETKNRPIIFNQMCVACHSLQGQGANIGPALDGVGSRRDASFISAWLHDPTKIKPDSKMPKLPLTEEDIVELTAFLSQLKETK